MAKARHVTATCRIATLLSCWMLVSALGLIAIAARSPAQAQSVVALVNHSPITSFDIEQRIKLAAITERKRLDRNSALKELIDDKLKLYEVRRIGYRVTEEGVDDEFSRLAKGNRQTATEFAANLRRAGIEASALKDKIRADLAWQTLLKSQVRQGTSVSNKDVEKAVEEEQKKAKTVTEFRLRQVLFVVPSGSSPGESMRAANAARAKFTACESGIEMLRGMRDVAVQDEIVRRSDALSKPVVDNLNKTPVGRMTAPTASSTGIEAIAVCEKREVNDSFGTRLTVENELTGKALDARAKTLIEELRKRVPIEYRR